MMSGRNPSVWLTMGHDFPAAAALAVLLYATFAIGMPRLAIVVLILAAGHAYDVHLHQLDAANMAYTQACSDTQACRLKMRSTGRINCTG